MGDRKFTLRQWRVIAGLSREELADKIGRAPMTIYNWEMGITQPNAVDIANLEDALNINWSQDILLPQRLR